MTLSRKFRQKMCPVLFMLLLCMVSFSPASASAVKVMGFTDISLLWSDRTFNKDVDRQHFYPTQRSRTYFLLNPSENTFGMFMVEIDNIWGTNVAGMRGGQIGTDGINIGVKEAYLNWFVPNTSWQIRMGMQPFVLPGLGEPNQVTGTVDSVVTMWARGAGIIASNEFTENFALTGFWMRPSSGNGLPNVNNKDTADIMGLVGSLKYDGIDIKPWLMYTRAGKNDNFNFTYRPTLTPAFPTYTNPTTMQNPADYAEGWWTGLTANISRFDPLRIGWEANYANIDGVVRDMNRGGWYTSTIVEYLMDSMTPGIQAWYTSGDDDNPNNGSERMPTILGYWYGPTVGFSPYSDPFVISGNFVGPEPTGTWGVSLFLRDIALAEKLKGKVRLAYYGGTNSADMAQYVTSGYTDFFGTHLFLYLTENDSIYEADFTLEWAMYKNLTWTTEIGWMSLDRGAEWDYLDEKNNVLSVSTTFRFTF